MVKQSSQPVLKKQRPRTCVGCGEESPKRTLLRVIKAPDGEVRYDPTGTAVGPMSAPAAHAWRLRRRKDLSPGR